MRWLVVFLLSTGLLAAQTESPVVGVGPFLHIISDLDQSLAFYHDALGLELTGPSGDHKFTDNPAVANLYGVPGKQFRAAVLKIPGSPMGIELVQWGEARKPLHKSIADPGAVTLILRVTDVEALASRAVKAGQAMMDRNGNKATFEDPDGFVVELEQAESAGGNLSISVSDVSKTTALYTGVLGFKADGDWLMVPGAPVQIRLTKATGTEGLNVSFPEPGRGMLRLPIRNIAALTESLKGAGFSVITTGGEAVTLPQGPRVIIVRDLNNFYLQPMEAPTPK
jgi:catechol 2,3-dioxygenase-like lactoylglutathione lyase family enzyme